MSSRLNQNTTKILADIERYFLGKHVQKFRGQLNLADALSRIMQFGCDDVSKRIWGEWPDALHEITAQYIADGVKFLGRTGHGGNPMGGTANRF